jgi:hypothetical protein
VEVSKLVLKDYFFEIMLLEINHNPVALVYGSSQDSQIIFMNTRASKHRWGSA